MTELDFIRMLLLMEQLHRLPLGDQIVATLMGPTELIRPTWGNPN